MTNEEALELLKDTNLILRCSFTGDIRIVEAIDMAIKALGKDTNVPTKWIPVSERLPDEDGQYLTTVKYEHVDGYEDIFTEYAEWYGNWDVVSLRCGTIESILAWMPLPDPWEGE